MGPLPRFAWPAPAWVLGLALGVGCGGRTVEGLSPTPAGTRRPSSGTVSSSTSGGLRDGPTPPDATETQGIVFDPAFDVAEQFRQACWDTCIARQPPVGDCPLDTTVEECQETCLEPLVNVDRACAQCLVDGLSWSSYELSCNDWECSCAYPDHVSVPQLEPEPRYSYLGGCDEDCAVSLAYQRDLRAQVEIPEDLGSPPDRFIELDLTVEAFHAVEEGFFWYDNRDSRHVGFASFTGELAWSNEIEFLTHDVRFVATGTPFVAAQSGIAHIELFDPTGERRILEVRADEIAPGREGELVGVASGTTLARYSLEGEVLEQYALPELDAEVRDVWALTNGEFLIRLSENVSLDSSPLVRVRPADGGDLVTVWQGDPNLGFIHLSEVPGQNLLVSGSARPREERAWPGTKEPVVRLLALDGEQHFSWRPSEMDLTLGKTKTLSDGGEHLCVASTHGVSASGGERTPVRGVEDRWAGRCSVYSCSGLSVRCFEPDGIPRWEFELRSKASYLVDANVVGSNLWVLARIEAEQTSYALLQFDLTAR